MTAPGDLYGELIAGHYRNPQNRGALEHPDAAHEAVNPLCGDRLRLDLRIEGGRISDVRFRGDACMVATASASLFTGHLRGLSLAEAALLSAAETLALLKTSLRPARIACALLPLEALRGALATPGVAK